MTNWPSAPSVFWRAALSILSILGILVASGILLYAVIALGGFLLKRSRPERWLWLRHPIRRIAMWLYFDLYVADVWWYLGRCWAYIWRAMAASYSPSLARPYREAWLEEKLWRKRSAIREAKRSEQEAIVRARRLVPIMAAERRYAACADELEVLKAELSEVRAAEDIFRANRTSSLRAYYNYRNLRLSRIECERKYRTLKHERTTLQREYGFTTNETMPNEG